MSAIDAYRRSIERVDDLDPDEERDVALAARAGDPAARERLVQASLPFVVSVAREYRRWGVPLEDLVQQGNIGLLKATERFEPSRGVRLITYAVYWIRAEIRDYVMRQFRMTRVGTTRSERRAIRAWRCRPTGTTEDLIADSGMPRERAERLAPLLMYGEVPLDARRDDQAPLIERLRDWAPSPEEHLAARRERAALREALGEALARLSERERRILTARLMSDDPVTLEALGAEMGVTKERVRQLEARLRLKLAAELLDFRPAA